MRTPHPESDTVAIANFSMNDLIRLLDREDLEDSQSLEQLQLDPGALNATANSLDPFGTARIGSPANHHEGIILLSDDCISTPC